jgi:transposase
MGISLHQPETSRISRQLSTFASQKPRFARPAFLPVHHVRFFEMMGGVWKEVVYDNMYRQEGRTQAKLVAFREAKMY